jgi:hypothetical protein
MNYVVGTYVPLQKVNQPFTGTFQEAEKQEYDYTFKTIGKTLKAFRVIQVVSI